MQKIKAAFFDRDGTLIKDVPYLSNLDDIQILPEAMKIALILAQQGYTLFVVTNQSGIARGFFDELFVHKTHTYLDTLLEGHGISIKKYYFCPHHPSQALLEQYKQDCSCRKPKPGMLINAANDHHIDLSASFMFGNSITDVDAGRAAGCKSFDITTLFGLSDEECAKILK